MPSHQRTLLFIEDDPDHQMLVRMSLAQHDRYRVLYANDGAEGFTKAREERPDVILLDVMMPKLDGLAVLERLQGDQSTRAIPVIFLSAKALPEDIKAGMDRGACGYLTKPFDALHLEERLDEILAAADL
ncbi:response regulator [Candidatus Poribacteria bacterium]|nr:response regulator [Candidatus Poribacteria bacterium]MBT5534780.1 response regulator [Candidatus Poribacteria bacterium]MBT5712606.1 response regulator [Candidatus Poribacteria bacterium]MBT7098984.1 response regulator [Candidatus Poribacteria bacterium]MBT7809445.1 response regulator [Candidatus Poribacteria bacterium]